MLEFFLGTDRTHWLRDVEVPLFISRRTLAPLRRLPRARHYWSLDSGGFTELSSYGAWTITPEQYIGQVDRFINEIGNLKWASIQDWMCEPQMLKLTKLSITQHQERTIDNYIHLRSARPDIPWTPVLQGWEAADYWRHWAEYERRGLDLASLPLVGVGSICRRQHTEEAVEIIASLANAGLKLHGFGFKKQGITAAEHYLVSADSFAWSFGARYREPLPGCTHKRCNHCLRYALLWRSDLLGLLKGEPLQESLLWQLHSIQVENSQYEPPQPTPLSS